MNKKIDGIKKINKKSEDSDSQNIRDENKYSRKIVLESIGEGEEKDTKGPLISDIKPASSKTASVFNTLKKKNFNKDLADNFIDQKVNADNLIINKKEKKKSKKSFDSLILTKKRKEKTALNKSKDDVLRKQINAKLEDAKEEIISFDDLAAYEKRSKTERKQELKIKEESKNEIKEKKKKKFKVEKDKTQKKDLARKKSEEKKDLFRKKSEEKKALARKKIEEKNALLRKKSEEKKALQEKKRKDLKNKIKKLKYNFRAGFNNLLNSGKTHLQNAFLIFKKRIKISLILFFSFLLIIIVFYLSFFIIITKFEVDNKISRTFAKVFPFPAFFVDNSFVDYYTYVDTKASFKNENLSEDKVEFFTQREIASKLILDSLEKRYGFLINQKLLKQDNFKNKISRYIMRDLAINTVALKRIKKIDEMIKGGGDFIKVSNKYGDNLGRVSLNDENKKDYSYYKDVINLSANEISDIVYAENGYYIFKCFKKENNSLDLSYVFIKGINFDEYFNNTLNSFKMISLVD